MSLDADQCGNEQSCSNRHKLHEDSPDEFGEDSYFLDNHEGLLRGRILYGLINAIEHD